MSRIGRKVIDIPKSVTLKQEGDVVMVKGPGGEMSMPVMQGISLEISLDQVSVKRADDSKPLKAAHGMTRAILNNMVVGVTSGFKKDLEIVGVGYRAQVQGKNLVLNLGYSHPIEFPIPDGITITVAPGNKISVQGIDKQRVGQIAALIRELRQPEPYKGKGIRYSDERIIRKAGKSGMK